MNGQTRHVERLAIVLAVLSLGVVGISAWLRLHGAGLGCVDWPACYGQILTATTHTPPPLGRLAHRIVATAALLLTLYLAWLGWRGGHVRPRPAWARPVFAMVGLMLFLSVVGIWSKDPTRITVNFVNLLGGMALVPMSWRIVTAAAGASGNDGRPDLPLRLGLALLSATVMLGALIGASYAALDESVRGVALHWLHRGLAVLAVLMLGSAALKRRGSTAGRVLLALLGLTAGLGLLLVVADLPLWAAVGHNIAAAALLAAVVSFRASALRARTLGASTSPT